MITVVAIVAIMLGIFSGVLVLVIQRAKRLARQRGLIGRVVTLPRDKSSYDIPKEAKYGKITNSWGDGQDTTWWGIEVEVLYPPKFLAKEREKVDRENAAIYKENLKIKREWQERVMSYQQDMLPSRYYGNTPPRPSLHPEVALDLTEEVTLRLRDVEVMPVGFDFVTEKVLKSLNKKGGGKKVTRMPRLFRMVIYLGITILIFNILWNITIHINDIAMFMVQTFITHK